MSRLILPPKSDVLNKFFTAMAACDDQTLEIHACHEDWRDSDLALLAVNGFVETTNRHAEEINCPHCCEPSSIITRNRQRKFICDACGDAGTLSPQDTRLYRSSCHILATALAALLGLKSNPTSVMGDQVYDLGKKDYKGWAMRFYLVGCPSKSIQESICTSYQKNIWLYYGEEPSVQPAINLISVLCHRRDKIMFDYEAFEDMILRQPSVSKVENEKKLMLLMEKHRQQAGMANSVIVKQDFLDQAEVFGIAERTALAFWRKNAASDLKNPGRPRKIPAQKPSKNH